MEKSLELQQFLQNLVLGMERCDEKRAFFQDSASKMEKVYEF